MRVICFYTTDAYKVLADRLLASAAAVGLKAVAYAKENPGGAWRSGNALKASVIKGAILEFPDESILYLDADCVVSSYPTLLDEAAHDYEMACHFHRTNEPTSAVMWFRKGAGLKYVDPWLAEVSKTPNALNDLVTLPEALKTIRNPMILHLPATYVWEDAIHRDRFSGAAPVIRTFREIPHSYD